MLSSVESSFKILVTNSQLLLLQQKLALATFPDELEKAGWAYSVPLSDIKHLTECWKNGYDWRKHKAALNAELPQYTHDIQVYGFGDINVRYVHKKSKVNGAIPLLFVHGCEL